MTVRLTALARHMKGVPRDYEAGTMYEALAQFHAKDDSFGPDKWLYGLIVENGDNRYEPGELQRELRDIANMLDAFDRSAA